MNLPIFGGPNKRISWVKKFGIDSEDESDENDEKEKIYFVIC